MYGTMVEKNLMYQQLRNFIYKGKPYSGKTLKNER